MDVELPPDPNPNAEPDPDSDSDLETADPIETAAELLADEAQQRLWLKVLTPILAQRSHETDPNPRVEEAYCRLYMAAANRAARICRADMIDSHCRCGRSC